MSPQESPPIACTLASGDFQERLTWIADLNREALLKHNRSDLTLTLVYDRQAIDRVRELMRREQTCCAFMSFQLDETADMVRLTITAPEEAREAADLLFEQFVPSENQRDICACGTNAPSSEATSGQARHRRSMNAVGATALTLGTGALACGACCVLPIAFPAIALAIRLRRVSRIPETVDDCNRRTAGVHATPQIEDLSSERRWQRQVQKSAITTGEGGFP